MFNKAKEKEAEEIRNENSKEIVCKFLTFLNSSYWKIPIDTFIEQQSVLFDHRDIDNEVVKQIQKEYITMVDVLIEAFCDDLHITLRELVTSLDAINKTVPIALEEEISLEPVIAAQDYDVFLSMMMRKNLEIQLQTIHIIELMSGNLPKFLAMDKEFEKEVKKIFNNSSESERYILISVMQKSREEFEREQQLRTEFERQIESAIKASLENQYKEVDKTKNIEDGSIIKNLSIQDSNSNKNNEKKRRKSITEVTETNRVTSSKGKRETSSFKIKRPEEGNRYMFRDLLKTPQGIDEEKIKEREEYLKEQRKKLLERKKKEREEKLKSIEIESKDRPKTASAAKKVMAGKMKNSATNGDVLEARKAIYDKLKTEVLNQ
uniref:Cilia- and flagella-associated protein 36 n=1 Tax=Parastrongyloides trichosuri TaxID=131310 RepID=A0A0N4ZPW2_PARTI